jgi:hypothetical protein
MVLLVMMCGMEIFYQSIVAAHLSNTKAWRCTTKPDSTAQLAGGSSSRWLNNSLIKTHGIEFCADIFFFFDRILIKFLNKKVSSYVDSAQTLCTIYWCSNIGRTDASNGTKLAF